MQIVNIANTKRIIHLFTRDWTGKQKIITDKSFHPHFYEPDVNGQYIGYDGVKLRRVVVSEPAEVPKRRTEKAYSADIIYTTNYLINKVDKIEPAPIKYFFLDIEVLAVDLPNEMEAKEPISCITIYNSFSKEYKTWWLKNYQTEKAMLNDFVGYVNEESPDLLLAWNIDFDYTYLHQRINDFAKMTSPIGEQRMGNVKGIWYPSGISIMDYLSMFKKIHQREKSYALDYIAHKYIPNEETWGKQKFGELDDTVMEKNINDVKRLVALEEQFKIIPYYDEIRLFSKAQWEDLTSNSRIIDSIILEEAKRRQVILPTKPKRTEEQDKESFEGAYRRADEGLFFDIYKADVASMYPNQLVNFCLDPKNICETKQENSICINGVHFIQDTTTMLPYITTLFMENKDKIKKQLKATDINSEEHKLLQSKYDAYKGLVNSVFGVCGFPSFRLYSNTIAGTIAFLARDLLHFVEEKMKAKGHAVIYTDTDSLFYKSDKDEIEYLNQLVPLWGATNYDKPDIDINFESEGRFEKIIILGKCHYYGYINSSKGTKREMKGVEAKRSSSSKYEAWFQEELLNKVLDNSSKSDIIEWIQNEEDRIKTLSFEEVAFPCKIGNKVYDKNVPIFLRAYQNSQKVFKNFKPTKGELFYYIFVRGTKQMNVMAFTSSEEQIIARSVIDWDEVIRRNIISKAQAIFDAMKWDLTMSLNNQMTLF